MLRRQIQIISALFAFGITGHALAQYVWVDDKGNKQYSDTAPPASVPKNRILKRVDISDAEEANKIFDILMGSEVPPRKSFIQSNAKLAEIDI